MGVLDGAVLVRDATVVAARRHAVMLAQGIVAARQILPRFGVEVAEGCRQAVAAVLCRCPAQGPECVLQSLGQCNVALAAQDHMGMLEARPDEAEVVEPMIECESAPKIGSDSNSLKA